ncbi:phage integrase family protein [Vibrio ponticus]|nr:phage integrase family protein [Vibrio ponticus]
MISAALIESRKFNILSSFLPDEETFIDTLERLLASGNSEFLNELIVFQDDGISIHFRDDCWAFSDADLKFDGGNTNLDFCIDIENYSNVLLLKDPTLEFQFQLKVFAVVSIYLSPNQIQLQSIKNRLNELKRIIPTLIDNGIYDFSMVTNQELDKIYDSTPFVFNTRTRLEGLNALYDLIPWLPFELKFSRLKSALYSKEWKEPDQFSVVPLRIYFDLMKWGKDRVKYYKSIAWEIELAVEKLLAWEEIELEKAIKEIRHGKRKLAIKPTKRSIEFVNKLNEQGVDLIDYETNPLWMSIFKKIDYKITINPARRDAFKTIIDGKLYGLVEIKKLLRDIVGTCGFVCLQLSGMRIDELYGAHVEFGAQVLKTSDNKRTSQKDMVYILTTRQSKIKKGIQTKKDTFVTTEDGYDAFKVLSAVYRNFNKRFSGKDKRRMWAGFRSCQSVKPCNKSTISNFIVQAIENLSNVSLSLSSEDLAYLNVSDPTKELGLGDKFSVTPHTLRRSLAYYLVGYELCSFPALKQQFSHLSISMTRWYARNSSNFPKIYKEVEKERVEQLADIYVRIYSKLANGERVAGGKGKEAAKEISRQGVSYFKDGANKNLLSREYWVEQLKNDVKHLHVIAPSMVCTNKLCSMRINIDLSECVDCEFDFIEDVAFAETSRIDAMRNLHLLYERNEINHSSLSKLLMTIRAAEKIMDDLNFKYEPYVLNESLSKMLIKANNH